MSLTDKPVQDLRREYLSAHLTEHDAAADALGQFANWFSEALNAGITEVNAMTLATVTPEGKPSARIVLLKGFSEKGFTFFTNYRSRKGLELERNPFASLVFFWKELERQVRIEGRVEKVDEAESDAYFRSRPKASQIGSAASPQSSVIAGREVLEARLRELEAEYAESETLPRPAHWGGYRVIPETIEFWQGGRGRVHDRLLYARNENSWTISRLAP
jgi:pyridoxamine 5'-phosphate oxidase